MLTRKLWSQTVLFFLTALFLLLLVWLFMVARPLLSTLLIAGLGAYLLDPAVRWVERRFRRARPAAAGAVFGATMLGLIGLIVFLAATLWRQAVRWERELQAALVEIERWFAQPVEFMGFQFNLEPFFLDLEVAVANALARLPLGSGTMLGSVTNNLLWMLAVLVSLYYFLKDGHRLKPWLLGLLPDAYRPETEQLLRQLNMVWGVFLRMQLLIMLILFLLIAGSSLLVIWLYRLGWLPLSPLGLALLLIAVYTAIQQVDNLWLRPRLLGRSLALQPGVVTVSIIAALALSGVLAAIIIVPLLASLKIVGRYVHAKLLGRPLWPAATLGGTAGGAAKGSSEATATQ